MFADRVLADDSLRATTDGWEVTVRIPWYRALPLSSVTAVTVALDASPVESGRIRFRVDGRTFGLTELPARWDLWWYVRDDAQLLVADPVPPATGDHEVRVSVGLYIPYLPAHGEPLVVTEWCTKTMSAAAVASGALSA